MSDLQKEQALTNGAATDSTSQNVGKPPLWHATPELDVYESANEYLIVLNVPGASPSSVDVQVLGSELRVRAEQAASPHHSDVALAAFERRLELPSEVDANSASAKLRDGVLEIQIQKSASARRVRIPVNAN
jgi:HSP20 family protein